MPRRAGAGPWSGSAPGPSSGFPPGLVYRRAVMASRRSRALTEVAARAGRIAASRESTLAFLARLPEPEILQPHTLDRRSVKDVLAHLLSCDEVTGAGPAHARGRADASTGSDMADADRFNARSVAARDGWASRHPRRMASRAALVAARACVGRSGSSHGTRARLHAHAAGAKGLAERPGLSAPHLIQVPLRHAVVELEAGRVTALAERGARSVAVANQRNVAAGDQRVPGHLGFSGFTGGQRRRQGQRDGEGRDCRPSRVGARCRCSSWPSYPSLRRHHIVSMLAS